MADTTQTGQQNSQYIASGGANEDQGGTQNTTETTATKGDPSANQNTPEIVVTASRLPKTGAAQELPGKRTYNPLSVFSSYNYQLTLYMITPDAYDAFMRSDRKNINAFVQGSAGNVNQGTGGAYIVAQGGGLGTDTPRAPGMKYDYYIDNLKITSIINTKSASTATNTTNISFTVYEPYGFSFISQLTNASNTLIQTSKLKNLKDLKNATRQFFVLGIKFLGYDKEGKIITGPELAQLTGNSEAGRTFEFFYDIRISDLKFKLDGKLTTYEISAVTLPAQTAFGNARGRITTGVEITGKTVEETLKALENKLNVQQEEITKTSSGENNTSVKRKNIYKIEYLGDIEDLKKAETVTEADKKDKSKWPMSPVAKTAQVNDGYAVKSTPDNTQRTFSFGKSITIMQAINSVIAQSTYLSDALKVIQSAEVDNMAGPNDTIPNPAPTKKLRWYNLSASVKCLDFDTAIGDFVYEITYYIQPYEIPYIQTPYADKTVKYYGPHKRYDYYYTGQNSEILSYEQVLNNAYFMATLIPTGNELSQGGPTDQPTIPMGEQNQDKTGGKNTKMQTQNTVQTSLYDPGSYATAKITIIGDPDFLMQDSPASANQIYRQYYGSNGFTVNPNGGQVFIEIDFKEGVDYSNDTGLMTINESVQFWKYSPEVSKLIKGVSYMLTTVDSTFSGGKFTQVLSGVITPFPSDKKNTQGDARSPDETTAETARLLRQAGVPQGTTNSDVRTPPSNVTAPTANSNQTSLGSGFKQDPDVPSGTNSSNSTAPDYTDPFWPTGETQNTTPTGGGPGINENVAGGTQTSVTNVEQFNTPTVNLNVANDDAVGITNSLSNIKRSMQQADAGRETENADQTVRNTV